MNVRLPDLGLGCAPLAGLFDAVDDDTARAVVDHAWELGVRYFDTAPAYGSGLSERRVGAALAERPREEFVLSTKVGRLLRPGEPESTFKGAPPLAPIVDFSASGVRQSVEESLERLQLERIDVALIHDPDDHLDTALPAVDALRDLVARVGVGTKSVSTALAFVRQSDIDCLLIAGRYTLLDRSAELELLPLCAERGVHVIAAGVFNSGLLSGGSTFDYEAAPQAMVVMKEALDAICESYGVPLAAAALQFPLRHPAVSTILVGARSAAEITEDLDLLALPVPDEFWAEAQIAHGPATLANSSAELA
jgi:D-threo-aldose 1-dehydrogenase